MKKNFLTLLVFLFGSLAIAGNIDGGRDKENTKLIYGKVIDKKSGEEIAGAEIRINDKTIYSDLNGNFSANVNSLTTEAEIKSISYNDRKINIDPFSYTSIVVELESK